MVADFGLLWEGDLMLFKKRIKLRLNFKSGNSVDLKCREYSFTYNNETLEFSGYKIDDMEPFVSFVPSSLESYIVIK